MMISRYDDSRLLLVRQTDHSEVVGFLAAHWGNDMFDRPEPYVAMVLAAQEHDKGWAEWEIQPTLDDQGFPVDYYGNRLEGWFDRFRRDTDRLIGVDPYAGLIALMHAVGLSIQGYDGILPHMFDRRQLPGAQEFLKDREQKRQELLAGLRMSEAYAPYATEEHVWKNYRLMEIFDLLGQFLCNRYPLNSTERPGGLIQTLSSLALPVREGVPDTTITIDVLDETHAVVRPYPFDRNPLMVQFPGRLVPHRSYASQDDFLREYYPAERVTITYVLHAGDEE